jgi:hypothetical protein
MENAARPTAPKEFFDEEAAWFLRAAGERNFTPSKGYLVSARSHGSVHPGDAAQSTGSGDVRSTRRPTRGLARAPRVAYSAGQRLLTQEGRSVRIERATMSQV